MGAPTRPEEDGLREKIPLLGVRIQVIGKRVKLRGLESSKLYMETNRVICIILSLSTVSQENRRGLV